MDSNSIILIAGASGTGKTSVANILEDKGLKVLKSYTTRAKRQGSANDDHVYITREEFHEIEDDMVAKTDFNGNLYGATCKQVDESDVYVIDLAGIDYFLQKYTGKKKPVVFYFDADENTRFVRMLMRGDSYDAVKSRLEHDAIAFCNADEMCPEKIDIDASILTPSFIADFILDKIARKEAECI